MRRAAAIPATIPNLWFLFKSLRLVYDKFVLFYIVYLAYKFLYTGAFWFFQ